MVVNVEPEYTGVWVAMRRDLLKAGGAPAVETMYLRETLHEITDVPHGACVEVERIRKEPVPRTVAACPARSSSVT